MKTITSLLGALVLTLTAALPASGSEQALQELQAMSDMTDAELQAMADDLGKTLEELGVMAKEEMGLGKPKTVNTTLDEVRAMSPGELKAFAAEIGNAACTEVRQAVEWSYPHGVLATEQQFATIERLEHDLADCQIALSKDQRTVETFITGENFPLNCLNQALLLPRSNAFDEAVIARKRERSKKLLEASRSARKCYDAYEQKFNREAR